MGWAALGTPQWQLTGMRSGVVFPIEVGVILLGAAGSLALAYLTSERDHVERTACRNDPLGCRHCRGHSSGHLDYRPTDGHASRRLPGMDPPRRCVQRVALHGLSLLSAGTPAAHDGPPYPIVSNQVLGMYRISVWTDPDTTEDGTAGGQFWVMIDSASGGRFVAVRCTGDGDCASPRPGGRSRHRASRAGETETLRVNSRR